MTSPRTAISQQAGTAAPGSFSPTVEVQTTTSLNPMLHKRRAGVCPPIPKSTSDLSDAAQHDRARIEEYLRDLDQVADDEPCFFTRMGEVIRARCEQLPTIGK